MVKGVLEEVTFITNENMVKEAARMLSKLKDIIYFHEICRL
jgi:hypothetical protein